MADLAISAAQALVAAVIFVAETIKAAIDEAEVVITDMPLVEAGLVTVRDALSMLRTGPFQDPTPPPALMPSPAPSPANVLAPPLAQFLHPGPAPTLALAAN